MIKILQVRNIDSFVESRRQKTSEKDKKTVQSILNDVRKNGDSAVKKYERKFNGRNTSQLRVSAKEIKEARSKISRKERSALKGIKIMEAGLRQNLEDWGNTFSNTMARSSTPPTFMPEQGNVVVVIEHSYQFQV